ncbi:hypothetical protein C8Q78DRAFT_521036 [Trametes maxima]|nr:hypothetical protein C8Q78DRAFT_521036 [Trametes maxima]
MLHARLSCALTPSQIVTSSLLESPLNCTCLYPSDMSNSDVQIKEMPVKPEARNAQPASLNRKLTYQPHLQPWVNLLSNSHGGEEHFSAGTNVCVYDVEETRRSPTMNTGWQRTDADSMYRVMRRYRRVLITTASLGDFTHTIPHRELLTTRRGKPKDQRYDIGEVCFTTRSYTVMFNRQPFEVPVATGVLIGATSSRTVSCPIIIELVPAFLTMLDVSRLFQLREA